MAKRLRVRSIKENNTLSEEKNNSKKGKSQYFDIGDLNHEGEQVRKKSGPVIEATDSFRDTQSTIGKTGRVWVYPQKPQGKRYDRRTIVSYILLAIFFVTPFIKINGNPLMMFNVVERKFIIFGSVFWPQDFIILALSFLTLVLFIVLFTSAWGRVWCGWLCPQTIFMEMVFRKIEYKIEGNANKQRLLNRMPWNKEKILKKGSKLLIFYAISFLIGNLFLSYIIGVDELYNIITSPVSEHMAGFTSMLIFSGIFFAVFSWFREQACTFVCPYGRLQSVLLDQESIVVAYDYVRGEPREKFTKRRKEEAGDCIDCKKCVFVCPTGIDIRNGTQMECVNCTACMDACDAVMEQIGKPKGLIRYASEKNIEEGKKFRYTGRMKFYTVILTILVSVIVYLLASRSNVDTRILRAKGQTYTLTQDNKVSNLYTMKSINKTFETLSFTIKTPDYNSEIEVIGGKDLTVPGNEVIDVTFLLKIPRSELKPNNNEIVIQLLDEDGNIFESLETNFSAPAEGQ